MIKLGVLLTLSSMVGLLFEPDGKIGIFLGLGLMIVFLFLRIEKAIKNRF